MNKGFVPKNMKEAIESGTESASAMNNIKVATYFYIGESAVNGMEDDINDFIENKNIIDIKFQVCHDNVLCSGVLIIYKED